MERPRYTENDMDIDEREARIAQASAMQAFEQMEEFGSTFDEPCFSDLEDDFPEMTDAEATAAQAAFDNAVDDLAAARWWEAVAHAPAHCSRHLLGE